MSHLTGKGKSSSNMPYQGGDVSFLEGIGYLEPETSNLLKMVVSIGSFQIITYKTGLFHQTFINKWILSWVYQVFQISTLEAVMVASATMKLGKREATNFPAGWESVIPKG